MKYRKKPIVIEAFALGIDEMPDWFKSELNKSIQLQKNLFGDLAAAKIKTLEGTMLAVICDYIIRGIEGEIYPCKPSIFEATYETVTENYTNE